MGSGQTIVPKNYFTLFRRFSSGYIWAIKLFFFFPVATFYYEYWVYKLCLLYMYLYLHLHKRDIQHLTDARCLITLKRVRGSNLINNTDLQTKLLTTHHYSRPLLNQATDRLDNLVWQISRVSPKSVIIILERDELIVCTV